MKKLLFPLIAAFLAFTAAADIDEFSTAAPYADPADDVASMHLDDLRDSLENKALSDDGSAIKPGGPQVIAAGDPSEPGLEVPNVQDCGCDLAQETESPTEELVLGDEQGGPGASSAGKGN